MPTVPREAETAAVSSLPSATSQVLVTTFTPRKKRCPHSTLPGLREAGRGGGRGRGVLASASGTASSFVLSPVLTPSSKDLLTKCGVFSKHFQ